MTFIYFLSDRIIGANYAQYFDHKNLLLWQIGFILMTPNLTIAILDFILATLADLYGRKKILLIGVFLCSLSYIGISKFDNFLSLALCMFLIGLGSALVSGVFTAWLVSELEKLGEGEIKDKAIANEVIIRNLTLVIGSLFSIILISRNPSYTFLFSGILLLIGFLPIFFIPENKGVQKRVKYNVFIKESLKEILCNGVLKRFSFSYFMFSIILGMFLFIWQRQVVEFGYEESQLGVFYLVLSIATLLGSVVFKKLKVLKENNSYKMIQINVGIFFSLLLMVTSYKLTVILGFLSYEFFVGIYFSCFYTSINREIKSYNRNTLLSLYSTIRFCGFSIGFFVASLLYGINLMFIWVVSLAISLIPLITSIWIHYFTIEQLNNRN
ncbi:MFS transporter [Clostridium sp. DL1XJH146]